MDAPPVFGPLRNLGIKVVDLDAEIRFLEASGATRIERGTLSGAAGERPYATAFMGSQRLMLLPRIVYESTLAEPLKPGLAHAVFEMPDLANALAFCQANGVRAILGPNDVSTPFGRRRVAFLRSPSGFIFEAFQPLE